MSLLKITCAFVFALALSFGVVSNNAWAAGAYSLTCQNAQLQGATLSAACQKAEGSRYQQTSLNLDQHIQNADGKMSWGEAAFSKTCTSAALSSANTLNAQCKKVDGFTPNKTSINLV
ncbi:CVNH domain-containing protein [Microcoleus sp. B4-C5]|uniref:CVNH domain-containing protein n=1 Tax=unclassified Microcoleus TaxID=2642155 RepID=UPI002FD5B8A3